MNQLNNALARDQNNLVVLKSDLIGVEDLMRERPVDPKNIIASMENRERQMEELQDILPKLSMFDTQRISQRCSSLSND